MTCQEGNKNPDDKAEAVQGLTASAQAATYKLQLAGGELGPGRHGQLFGELLLAGFFSKL